MIFGMGLTYLSSEVSKFYIVGGIGVYYTLIGVSLSTLARVNKILSKNIKLIMRKCIFNPNYFIVFVGLRA